MTLGIRIGQIRRASGDGIDGLVYVVVAMERPDEDLLSLELVRVWAPALRTMISWSARAVRADELVCDVA